MDIYKYQDSDKEGLRELLVEFCESVYGNNGENIDIDEFVEYNRIGGIYIVKTATNFVGFITYVYNTNFGLCPPTLMCTYTFIRKEYRRSRATLLLANHQLEYGMKFNLPLEHFYASSDSLPFAKRMESKEVYRSYTMSVETQKEQYARINRKGRKC